MPRSISIVRRKPNLIDLTVRRRTDVTGFRFSSASNFDAAFTAFQTVSNDGMIVGNPNTPEQFQRLQNGYVGSQYRDHCRFLFDPAAYTGARPEIRDDVPWFVRLEPRNPDGSFGTAEAMHMVMPPSTAPMRPIQLSGTVPQGAALVNSLEIQLPGQCYDWEIENEGANVLMIAFERGGVSGPEYELQPMTSIFRSLKMNVMAASQIFLRGVGGPTAVSIICALRNNPISY